MWIVPEDYSFKRPGKVVYALNYEEKDIRAIKKLLRFLETFTPHITLLHISEKDNLISQGVFSEFRFLAESELGSSPKITFTQIADEDTAHGIDTYATQNEVDLVVLLTREYYLLERIFHTSISRRLSFIASYPLLVYH